MQTTLTSEVNELKAYNIVLENKCNHLSEELDKANAKLKKQAIELAYKNSSSYARLKQKKLLANDILKKACELHSVSEQMVKSSRKPKKVVSARYDAISAIYFLVGNFSTIKIGELVGYRDHSTIIRGMEKRGYKSKVGWPDNGPTFDNAKFGAWVMEVAQ